MRAPSQQIPESVPELVIPTGQTLEKNLGQLQQEIDLRIAQRDILVAQIDNLRRQRAITEAMFMALNESANKTSMVPSACPSY